MYSECIDQKIAAALKEGNAIELRVWRDIKTEFLNYLKSPDAGVLTETIEEKIINKLSKEYKESVDGFISGGCHDDRLTEAQNKLDFIANLLPKEPTKEEIEKAVSDAIASLGGVASMKNMKDIQAYVKDLYPMANGGIIADVFKDTLKNN